MTDLRERIAKAFYDASGFYRHGGPWVPGCKPEDCEAIRDSYSAADAIIALRPADAIARATRAEAMVKSFADEAYAMNSEIFGLKDRVAAAEAERDAAIARADRAETILARLEYFVPEMFESPTPDTVGHPKCERCNDTGVYPTADGVGHYCQCGQRPADTVKRDA